MVEPKKIEKGLDVGVEPLLEILGECKIDMIGGSKEDKDNDVFLYFERPSDVSFFITMLVQTNETESSSLTSRVLIQDGDEENSWTYITQIFTNLLDTDKPDDEVDFSVGAIIAFPFEDYDEVLSRVTQFRDKMLEPEDESCKIAGFCKECFIVDLERLIEIDEIEIIDLETGVTSSGSGIESVSLKGEIVQVSLAR